MTAWSYLHSSGYNTSTWHTDGQTGCFAVCNCLALCAVACRKYQSFLIWTITLTNNMYSCYWLISLSVVWLFLYCMDHLTFAVIYHMYCFYFILFHLTLSSVIYCAIWSINHKVVTNLSWINWTANFRQQSYFTRLPYLY